MLNENKDALQFFFGKGKGNLGPNGYSYFNYWVKLTNNISEMIHFKSKYKYTKD